VLEADAYRESGGPVQTRTVSLPWTAQTASHAESGQPGLPAEIAYLGGVGTSMTASLLTSGSWRTIKTVNLYSPTTGLLQQADAQGDLAGVGTAASTERCTSTTYATPPTSGPNTGMVDYPARVVTVAPGASGPVGTAACPAPTSANTLTDKLIYYDANTTSGVITSVGDVTHVSQLDVFNGTTPHYVDITAAASFDAYGRLTGSTDARGLVTTIGYTPATGQLPTSMTTTDVSDSFVTTQTMDQARQTTTKVVDRNGFTTQQSWDALGRRLSVWLPGRGITQTANLSYVYTVSQSAPSTVLTKTLRDDATYATSYDIYDGFGQVRQNQSVSLDGSNHANITDSFYDSHGWLSKKTSPYATAVAPSTTWVGTADASVPGETLYTHDGRGRVTITGFYSYAQPQWQTSTAYPGADRTDSTPPAGGTATSTITDAVGRRAAIWTYTTATPTGVATDAHVISYAHNPDGTVSTVTGPDGRQWSYTYDHLARVLSTTDPDTGTTTSTYDAAGDVLTSTDANNQLLTYTYDSLGRRTASYAGTAQTGTKLAAWTYDTAPNGKGMPAGQTSYVGGATGIAYTNSVTGYTNHGQVTGTTTTVPTTVPTALQPLAGSYSASYTYGNMSGLPLTASYGADAGLPAETITYSYNQNGVLTNFGGASVYLNTTQVDPFGRITRWTLGAMPNQVAQTALYDPATGRVTEQFLDKESGSTHVDDLTNLYNPAGEITAATDVRDGTSTDLQCYDYNQIGQLTDAWTDTAGVTTTPSPSVPNVGHCTTATPSTSTLGGPEPYWETYHYNTAGNRDTATTHDPGGNTTNDIARTFAYNPVGSRPDLLQSQTHTGPGAGTDSYGYDLAGQTTTRTIAGGPHQTITYTPLHQTATVSDTAGNSTGYTYDATGQLLLQTTNTSATLYLGVEQLTLTTATHALTGLRYYTTGGGPTIVRSAGGTLTYEATNGQGTGLVLIDSGSAQTETRRAYTPFGTSREATPPAWVDNHAFLNQPTDQGLDLLGARVYDPGTGRFLQRDKVFEAADPRQLDGYTYAAAAPTTGSDPTGLQRQAGDDGDAPIGSVDPCTGTCATERAMHPIWTPGAQGPPTKDSHNTGVGACPNGCVTVEYLKNGTEVITDYGDHGQVYIDGVPVGDNVPDPYAMAQAVDDTIGNYTDKDARINVLSAMMDYCEPEDSPNVHNCKDGFADQLGAVRNKYFNHEHFPAPKGWMIGICLTGSAQAGVAGVASTCFVLDSKGIGYYYTAGGGVGPGAGFATTLGVVYSNGNLEDQSGYFGYTDVGADVPGAAVNGTVALGQGGTTTYSLNAGVGGGLAVGSVGVTDTKVHRLWLWP
jgi:RHS repeat-associated protein